MRIRLIRDLQNNGKLYAQQQLDSHFKCLDYKTSFKFLMEERAHKLGVNNRNIVVVVTIEPANFEKCMKILAWGCSQLTDNEAILIFLM